MESDEPEEEDEEIISKYKNTGSKRTFLLAISQKLEKILKTQMENL